MRKNLRERLNLEFVDPKNLIDTFQKERFTGFLKTVEWDKNSYLLLLEGQPVKVIEETKEGLKYSDPSSFSFPEKGTLEVYETDDVALVRAMKGFPNPHEEGPMFVMGFGEEFQGSTPFKAMDMDKFLLMAERSFFNGYLLFHTKLRALGIMFLYNGKPVGVFSDNRSGERAINNMRSSLPNSFVTVYLLDPAYIPLILATYRIDKFKEFSLEKEEDFDKLRSKLKTSRESMLLYGETLTQRCSHLFYRGTEVLSLTHDLFGSYPHEEQREPDKVSMYRLFVDPRPQPISVRLTTSVEDIGTVPSDRVSAVKDAFLEEIGPIGKILWNKILGEFGWQEDKIPVDRFDELLIRLSEEIPEESHRREFLRRVRRL